MAPALGDAANATGGFGTVGTSGSNVGLLNANLTYSGNNQHNGTETFDDTGSWGSGGIAGTAINSTAIGVSTAAAGHFTTLAASSTVSGSGFSTYLASPPAIGGSAPAAGSFTTLSASGTVSGAGFSTYLASPPAIGGSAAAAGSFTTLAASGTVTFGSSTTGSTAQTYTNSPCTTSATTAQWIPVSITGQSGTFYVAACH